ncbi:MAG: HEAT repeat domain-containing protein [Polyangiaceae bacterium]|nr:HEAT repeat domain-containing protein [Polyangiaceae bacterium]MCL4753143.1 HEAT repeat domain-containing protein [Myxococcales bacterium]
MSRAGRRIVVSLLAWAVLAVAAPAWAEDAIDKAADKLKNGDDFRVRTQAALSLGASKSKRAVEPLCGGLEDENTTVRTAAAAGLGKLKKGGEDCLEKRLEDESNAGVKAAIKKALAGLKGASEPAITAKTKVYLFISKPSDKTGRSGDEVPKLVRSMMVKAAGSEDGFVIAPADETPAVATKRLAKWKGLKAFMLSPKVLEPKYSGGSLQIKIDVAIFTYPGKALKGNIPVKLTQDGVSGRDTDSEDDLIKMAAERAIQKFSQNMERIQ